MLNRGKLRRDIEKGLMESRMGFHIEDDSRFDRYGKETDKWIPARVMKHHSDWKEGHMNIREHEFKSKSGSAWKSGDIIHFGAHSNENILLRYKKKK